MDEFLIAGFNDEIEKIAMIKKAGLGMAIKSGYNAFKTVGKGLMGAAKATASGNTAIADRYLKVTGSAVGRLPGAQGVTSAANWMKHNPKKAMGLGAGTAFVGGRMTTPTPSQNVAPKW